MNAASIVGFGVALMVSGTALAEAPVGPQRHVASAVVINGNALSDAQVAALAQMYGVRPLAGNYWYDAATGLYGVVGYPAFGFMRPGHAFGALRADASAGNTRTFINGRELPQGEYLVWCQLVGSYIQPARYWVDQQGNAGLEGSRAPLLNLYAMAMQNLRRGGGGGGGGGGDNFWTSRFSAGNSDHGGSRGYVSVPGYGPVGYGF